jgi:hypothetical protein
VLGTGVNIGQLGQAGDPNYWLWVQSGGQVNAADDVPVYLYSVMTNAGLVNLTNQVIDIYNNGTSGAAGGLFNQAGGVIDLWYNAGIKGNYYGSEYVVNQGTINLSGGPDVSGINVFNLTNTGTLNAQLGTLQLQATHLILQPSETLSVGLGGAGDYGTIAITGNALLAGAFSLESDSGFIPRAGQAFTVLTYGSYSGAFSSFSLPGAAVAFKPVYGTNALTVAVQPLFALVQETNLVFNANGAPGSQTVLLASTNLTVPLTNWTPVATNTFGVDGYLTFTTNLPPGKPQEFFIQELQ